MADRIVDILLVGGGIASATAAETLRDEGFDGSILLVGRELDPPYHRPPCSKGYLQGKEPREEGLLHPAAWWGEHGVELLTRTGVLELDAGAKTAALSTGEEVGFHHALLATGSLVRRLHVDGASLEGIHYLRTAGNSDTIRDDTDHAEQVVCVGGSYIGCEVAATLTERGKRMTILMQEDEPLSRQFGREAGKLFRAILEEHGIEIVGGEEVAHFGGEGERVRAVHTKEGRVLDAQAVVCGVGVTPDIALARKAGLAIGDRGGVRVDSRLRSSAEGIYAAGDIAEYDSVIHGRPMRLEHEDVAAQQGATAARNMLGQDRPHDVVPYFFSDLSDWAWLEYVGPAESFDQEIVRGGGNEFAVWYLEDGRVRGMLSAGGAGDLDRARELIVAGEPVDPDDL